METEKQNYGMPEGDSVGVSGPPKAMSDGEERTWSALAHLSIFANLFTGFLGPVVALGVWLFYKDRSEKVAFQALQSVWYQAAWIAILGAGWVITGLLTLVLIGFLLIPVMALLTLVPLGHATYAAYKVNKYGEYRYPLIADLISR